MAPPNLMNIFLGTRRKAMKIYGYARISRPSQSIERQVRNIKGLFPTAIIVEEAYSGTTMNRPKWENIMRQVQEGDLIVFDSVSRMARTADEGFEVWEKLFNMNVTLVFLKEPQVNTETYRKALNNAIPMTNTSVDIILKAINEYLLTLAKEQIRLAFEQAEKEVTDLHQRTREGIETARLNGKQIGQKKGAKLTTKKSLSAKEIIKKHSVTFGGSLKDEECWKLAGISSNSFYKYKSELIASA
jgi:DNA invertase Pin-like site-specific DNA recombinase